METLTNIIEAVLFASGQPVAISDLAEKLEVGAKEVKKALEELSERYGGETGVSLLLFNGKAQLATNPAYKEKVEAVLNPIRQKELTKTVLECAAVVAYRQPVTRGEIELIRGVNSDYPMHVLLELKLIEPVGRKDSIGHPVLYATTDEFLKRFKLNSLSDLPDYEELLASIKRTESYLYSHDVYEDEDEEEEEEAETAAAESDGERPKRRQRKPEGDPDVPEFLRDLGEDVIKIE